MVTGWDKDMVFAGKDGWMLLLVCFHVIASFILEEKLKGFKT